MAVHFRDTPLRRFMEHPRPTSVGRWVQTKLVRLAAGITYLRNLDGRMNWVMWPGWQRLRLAIIAAAFRSGLIHASFTFIAWASNASDSTTSTTIDTTTALNVAAGDTLATWVKHEGTSTTITIADSVAGNSHTVDAGDKVDHSNGDLSATFGYVLSAAADASFTGRATFGVAKPFRSIIVAQFRPDAGETVSKDTSATGQGNGTAVQSGTYTTSGTDEVTMGGYGEYVAATSSSHQINGVAADAVRKTDVTHANNFTAAWYRIISATFAAGRSTCTAGASGDWIGCGIAFTSVPAGALATQAVSPLFIMGTG